MDRQPDSRNRATRGGSYVLALVGLAMIVALALGADNAFDAVLLGAIGAGLVWGALRLARFVREHGDDIGEARFDTRNKD